ncbi:MAG: hypothetical protein RLZZ527_894, partial [Actinomycetota bacterium]
ARVEKSLEQMFGRILLNDGGEPLCPTRAVPHFRPRFDGAVGGHPYLLDQLTIKRKAR